MSHNKILKDENNILINNVSKLENLIDTSNTFRPQIYTPRLFGEVNEDNSSNKSYKEPDNISNYVKSLHEFYSNKLSIVLETINYPENYQIYNKQLNEVKFDFCSSLDDKLMMSIKKNLETLIQIQNNIYFFANKQNKDISMSIVQDDSCGHLSQSESFSYNHSIDFFQEIQNPKLLKQGSEKKIKLSESKFYPDSIETELKKLQKISSGKEIEINILRKKELAYQNTIHLLSNELLELKKKTEKKSAYTNLPHSLLTNIDFYSSKTFKIMFNNFIF